MQGLVIASSNGNVGIAAAVDVLRQGGAAVDAVVAGTRPVEANPEDHSVGFSGLPNMDGVVELDATLMDGRGLRAGSVGGLRDYAHAIDVAQAVMEQLPHVLLVGDGGQRLAAELDHEQQQLLTPEARDIWLRRVEPEDAPISQTAYYDRVRQLVAQMASDPQLVEEPPHGTVNFIARDRTGNIACAVSTSGWAWKYPGRVGDSGVIGAGNYADNLYGAAACTGRGEMAQRCLTAHSVVTFMRFGMPLDQSVRQGLLDLAELDDPYASEMNIVAMDAQGNHTAASTTTGRTYIYMSEDMRDFIEAPRTHVPI